MSIGQTFENLLNQTAFANLNWGNYVMILVACVFLFLAIAKGFEPLLLVPIAFGMLLVNIYPTIMDNPTTTYTNAEGNTVATVDYEGEGLDLLCAMNANEIVPVSDNETQLVDASGVVVATITSADGYTAEDLAYLLASGSYTMTSNAGGLLHYFYILDEWSILPSLIFMGVGAMTDFAPLIANPISFLMGAAAQLGIYVAYFLAMAWSVSMAWQLQLSPSSAVLTALLPSSWLPSFIRTSC